MKHVDSAQRSSAPLIRDVIEIILSHLYEFSSPTRKPSPKFAHCALISRAWRVPVQRLLFREVGIGRLCHLVSLEQAVTGRTEHARRLAQAVRVLWVRISDITLPGTVLPGQLARCIRLFPLLYELRIELVEVRNLDDATLRALENTPPIRALRLYRPAWSTNMRTHSGFTNVHLQLLNVARWQLQYFVMEGMLDYTAPPQNLRPPRHRFKEIILHLAHSYNNVTGPTTSQLLKWILKNSNDSIEGIGIKYYAPVLARWIPRLKWVSCIDGLHIGSMQMPKAREIMWLSISSGHVATTIHTVQLLCNSSHGGLVHVGFHGCEAGAEEHRWRAVVSKLPSSVKYITYLHSHCSFSHDVDSVERVRAAFQRVTEPGIQVSVHVSQLIWSHYSLTALRPLIPREEYPHIPSIQDYAEMTKALKPSRV